jgi:superfamily I DNA/RNA helicase/mRNA-degrading endonuclease RelE of RelBE toxin-antitoxin system
MADWRLTFKQSFLHELNTFEPKLAASVLKKLDILSEDPTPDAKTKKQLKYLDGKLHRLRVGDLRVFYTFQSPYVSLLAVKRRDEHTYDDEDIPAEFLGGTSGSSTQLPTATTWSSWLEPSKSKAAPLRRAIDKVLLTALKVPEAFHDALMKVATEDDLLDCPVPQDILGKVIDAVLGRPIEQVAAQPDLLVNEPDDLLRYREGDLLAFLLRLDPDQEKLARWAVTAQGATLLKGGPGTGKSTVALYRTREVLAALKKAKIETPRILFTTYTRALTRVSEQLLEALVGKDEMKHIEVKTADVVLRAIAVDGGASNVIARDLKQRLPRLIEQAAFQGSALKVTSQREAIAKMTREFLLEEILSVIEGRGLATLEDYQHAARPGRRVSLTKMQREAVWRVHETLQVDLVVRGETTWEGWRKRAAERVQSGEVPPTYDAVLIDEAQDLAPVAIAALVGLCKRPSGVFLAADANQSIYGAGFRWSDAHAWLKFSGRTGVLKANHRSTKEIDEAAAAYMRAAPEAAELDEERVETTYVHAGALPAVRAVTSAEDEAKLLARFFRQATRSLKLGLGSAAVLTPTNEAAGNIAAALNEAHITAKRVEAQDLDLTEPGVKVLTLKNAKGLEFPIVALAGFIGANYPFIPAQATDDERDEVVAKERRTMFVAMTRAMRALLVVLPAETDSPLLQGCVPPAWNDGRQEPS